MGDPDWNASFVKFRDSPRGTVINARVTEPVVFDEYGRAILRTHNHAVSVRSGELTARAATATGAGWRASTAPGRIVHFPTTESADRQHHDKKGQRILAARNA